MKTKRPAAPVPPATIPGRIRTPAQSSPLQQALTKSKRVRDQGKLAEEVNRSPRARPANADQELILLHAQLALEEEEKKRKRGTP